MSLELPPALSLATAAFIVHNRYIVHCTQKVREQIKNLHADSAPGPDGISPKVLKELEEVVDTPLAIIFKKSLSEGTVPLDWKIAKVTPIYK